jgi:hypothetical protein
VSWQETIHFGWRTLDLPRTRAAAAAAAEDLPIEIVRVGWVDDAAAHAEDLAIELVVSAHGCLATLTLASDTSGARLRIDGDLVEPQIAELAVEYFVALATSLGGALDADRFEGVGSTTEDIRVPGLGPRDAVVYAAFDDGNRHVLRGELPRAHMLDQGKWAQHAVLHEDGRRARAIVRAIFVYHDELGRAYQRIVERFDADGRRTERVSEAIGG